jgi:hypothetical protein
MTKPLHDNMNRQAVGRQIVDLVLILPMKAAFSI